jgi:flagella basal body P-ring formation protein FlgA
MSRLALALLLSLLAAPLARAAQVTTLIAEKAAAEIGGELPANGRFDVTLQTTRPTRAELVSAFWMDRATGQFAANVVTRNGETRRVYGLAILTLPVPVPTHRILPDAILSKADFRKVPLPYQRLNRFVVTDLHHLAGMQVRQVLSAGRPVLTQQVSPPLVIDRGARVAISYIHGRLALTAPGRAITSAEAGKPVRVVNLASNRTVTGIARPGGIVEVTQ